MKERTIVAAGRRCTVFPSDEAKYLLIQPVDEHDVELLEREVSLISAAVSTPFILAAFLVEDWNRDLSPWDAPPVFGRQPFGHGAPETLAFVERDLIPAVTETCGALETIPVVLGGYSLAAFFALWSVYQPRRPLRPYGFPDGWSTRRSTRQKQPTSIEPGRQRRKDEKPGHVHRWRLYPRSIRTALRRRKPGFLRLGME